MLTDNTLDKLIGYAPITDDQNIGYNTYRYNQQGGIDIGYPIDPVRPGRSWPPTQGLDEQADLGRQ